MEKRGNLEVGGVGFEEAPDLTIGESERGGIGVDLGNALVASEFPVDHEETGGRADGQRKAMGMRMGTDAAAGLKGGGLVGEDVVVDYPFLAVAGDKGDEDNSI